MPGHRDLFSSLLLFFSRLYSMLEDLSTLVVLLAERNVAVG